MGDFNAHNLVMWSNMQNNKGKTIEDLLNQEGLCIFNDGLDTYIHPGIGSNSTIDLTFARL